MLSCDVCTVAVTSPASAPSIAKPRIWSDRASTTAFKKRVSPSVRARGTTEAGTFAALTSKPLPRASRSVRPNRPSQLAWKRRNAKRQARVLEVVLSGDPYQDVAWEESEKGQRGSEAPPSFRLAPTGASGHLMWPPSIKNARPSLVNPYTRPSFMKLSYRQARSTSLSAR